MQPSPVVTLNRAVAVSKVRGPAAALAMIEPLAAQLSGYFHFFGVKGRAAAAARPRRRGPRRLRPRHRARQYRRGSRPHPDAPRPADQEQRTKRRRRPGFELAVKKIFLRSRNGARSFVLGVSLELHGIGVQRGLIAALRSHVRGQTVTTQQHIRIEIPQGVLNGRTTAGKTTSDQTLIERIAVGDKLAMRVLFARHHVRVYRFVARLVRDETLAEDVVGEMFLDVWRQAATFKARAAVLQPGCSRSRASRRCRCCGAKAKRRWTRRPRARSRTRPTTRKLQCGRRSEVKFSASAGRNCRQNIGTSSISSFGESDRRGRRDNRNPREHREDAHVLREEALGRVAQRRRLGCVISGDDAARFAVVSGVPVVNRKLREWCTAHESVAAKAQCRPITRRQEQGPTLRRNQWSNWMLPVQMFGGDFFRTLDRRAAMRAATKAP